MRKSRKLAKTVQKALDRDSNKRPRGRPGVRKSEIQSRAYNFGLALEQNWNVLAEAFLKAQSEEEFGRLFEKAPDYVISKFAPIRFALIEKIRTEPKFPRTPEKQRVFFADSLAGLGGISPRRSRDICAEGRKKKRHMIIRQDYYIECTCGYEGPAKHGACPECGTLTVAFSKPRFPELEGD
ncbi:MAG: hypothetical protein ACE5HL_03360 [Terriglobia bacterium]